MQQIGDLLQERSQISAAMFVPKVAARNGMCDAFSVE
jgi:hypothetical protein